MALRCNYQCSEHKPVNGGIASPFDRFLVLNVSHINRKLKRFHVTVEEQVFMKMSIRKLYLFSAQERMQKKVRLLEEHFWWEPNDP